MTETTPTLANVSAVKLALMAKMARSQAEAVLRADPIAIVGMACRVPGGGDTPEKFWDLLKAGGDAVREVPSDRWNAAEWYDADPAEPSKAATKSGGFIDRIDAFDAAYFGILPREAERMDPQQRLLLEVAVEALADAGLPDAQLRGSRAGVFIASYHNDYAAMQYSDVEAIDARTLTGTLHSVLANRLSFLLDLRGPSLSIDTACSSSLVAIHLACQSLRFGETDVAVAGGVSLMVSPDLFVSMSKIGFMSPDGRCKTFDSSADGFGRGEGCGVIVLKRLADALADGDRVLAVVRGSAVNQDGHSTVLAAPNGLAQQAMIVEALANAQLPAGRIGFVEAHGTGTALGDPIEVEALAATVGRRDASADPCYVGAAKASIGHLEAAAGVAGVIKAVLAMRHEAIPPQAHFRELNPHISLANSRLAIPTALVPWPAGAVPRCAGISSFGVGGTNAHVIIEEAPALSALDNAPAPDVARVLALSARSPEALRALADDWVRFLGETPSSTADICYTAAERRSHHDVRLAITGTSNDELRARLEGFVRDEPGPDVAAGRRSSSPPKVAFVFSGQGPQWFAMGRELLATEPVFASVMTECDALLRPVAGWSLLEELAAPEEKSRLNETEVAQPALFALQVALAALWKSWGISPNGVVGHSIGEMAALHVAGVLSLADAVRVVWNRGHIMQKATGLGVMASVSLSPEEAGAMVSIYGERLSIGAINGPRTVVLSGEKRALQEVLAVLTLRGVNHKLLPVQYAFHSAQMAPFQQQLAAALAGLEWKPPMTAVYSTVTGGAADDERFDSTYFGRNVREPVRFANAIAAMGRDGFDVFLEIGPHPVLSAAIAECLPEQEPAIRSLYSLRRNSSERDTMLRALAGLYAAGCDPAWSALEREPGQVVSLPSYPWQRERYWIRPRPIGVDARPGTPSGHALLGTRIALAGSRVQIFEGGSAASEAWLADHRVFDRVLLPAAAVLNMFAAAAGIALGGAASLTDFVMQRPLTLPEPGSGHARWQTVVMIDDGSRASIELHEAIHDAQDGGAAWRLVASASASTDASVNANEVGAVAASSVVDRDAFYERFAELGIAFGPAFQGLRDIRRGDGVAEGTVELPAAIDAADASFALHPVLIDAAMQLCSVAAASPDASRVPEEIFLPIGVDRFHCAAASGTRLEARARIRTPRVDGSIVADITVYAPGGAVVAVVEGMRFARASAAAFGSASGETAALYEVRWDATEITLAPPGGDSMAGSWILFADDGEVADELAREITSRGGTSVMVRAGSELREISAGAWTVNPAEPRDFTAVLDALNAGAQCRGAVHLWNLDLPELGAETDETERTNLLGVGSLLHLVQALVARSDEASIPLSVVTSRAEDTGNVDPVTKPRAAGARGLASVVAVEHPELSCRVIDIDGADGAVRQLAAELLRSAGSTRVALRGTRRHVPRLARRGSVGRVHAGGAGASGMSLYVARSGTLDGLALRPVVASPPAADEVRLRVLAAGVNFRDVLLTLGMYPGAGIELGAEAAGVVIACGAGVKGFAVGDHVFGFVPASMAAEVNVPAAFLARIPSGLSAESAAALPVAMMTAWYGLFALAGLKRGERVLIHAGTGGVGMAAVQLAQRCGAEVFATAGNPEKRDLLRARGVQHVFDSRTLTFADEVLDSTGGKGVDVVLNSLSGEFIGASVRTLGADGRFLEIGKRDIWSAEQMAALRPDVRYDVYDLGGAAFADRTLLGPMLGELVAALSDGSLEPLPVRVFPFAQAEDAFRFMAQAKHIGKIVLSLPAHGTADESRPIVVPNATYLVTGGGGGLGLLTARWLVESGATHVVLVGRHQPDEIATTAIRALESDGATVKFMTADAGDAPRMRELLLEIRATLPPLRGVLHAAGALDDGVLIQQSWNRAATVLRGKADGAFVLHGLTLDASLDFFVLYSAAALLLGAPGQGAYAAANAELDALALARRASGLPALSVSWGAWAGAGMAAKAAQRGHDSWGARGLRPIDARAGFTALEELLRSGAAHAAMLPVDWTRFLATLPAGADASFFRDIAPRGANVPAAENAPPSAKLAARLLALPASARRDALGEHLRERAAQVIGLSANTSIDGRTPLKELGLDSLMAVELRNSLARSVGHPLPATLLFDYPTLDALTTRLSSVLQLEEAPASATARSSAATSISALSDAEAEAQLLAELGADSPGALS